MENSKVEKSNAIFFSKVEKNDNKAREEKNLEFEIKLEVNKLLIDSLMRKNMKKEALLESQKNKSNSHRAKIDQSKKWQGMEHKRTTRRFLKEIEHWHLANDIESDIERIKILFGLLEKSALDWFDRKINSNSNFA